jgi:tRNA pseudouridine55 synthase
VLLVGQATRLAQFVDGEPKVYEAVIGLGTETDTDDATGSVIREASLPSFEAVDRAIALLTGALDQVPPSYSAKQSGGVRAPRERVSRLNWRHRRSWCTAGGSSHGTPRP